MSLSSAGKSALRRFMIQLAEGEQKVEVRHLERVQVVLVLRLSLRLS